MSTFKDAKGKDWVIEINVNAVKRIKNMTGVDVTKIDNGKDSVFAILSEDMFLLADVLYAACKKQADERQMSPDDFGESLSGDVIESATEAFMDALIAFFPNPRRRDLLKKAAGKGREMVNASLDLAEQRLNQISSLPGGLSGGLPGSLE